MPSLSSSGSMQDITCAKKYGGPQGKALVTQTFRFQSEEEEPTTEIEKAQPVRQ